MRKLIKSFGYALSGIWLALTTQSNLQIHSFVFLLMVAAGLFFGITYTEWLIVFSVSSVVIVAEMFNTSIEKAVDLASPDFHPFAKQAKDVAAGAVLIAAAFAVLAGLLIFGSRVLQFMSDYL